MKIKEVFETDPTNAALVAFAKAKIAKYKAHVALNAQANRLIIDREIVDWRGNRIKSAFDLPNADATEDVIRELNDAIDALREGISGLHDEYHQAAESLVFTFLHQVGLDTSDGVRPQGINKMAEGILAIWMFRVPKELRNGGPDVWVDAPKIP